MKCALILLALTYVLAAPIEDDGALQEFVNGNRAFTAAVYKEVTRNNRENLVVSPFSVETILALTAEAAQGYTAAELITGLSLPSTKEKTEIAFQSLLPKLRGSDDGVKVSVANKIYVENGVVLDDTFKSVAASIYGSGVENVEFQDSVDTAAEINSWVEEQTNHKIQNLISPDAFSDETLIVLVNALYLKGQWENPFSSYGITKQRFFTSPDDFVEVDTMYKEAEYPYYENNELGAKYLELPLIGGDVSLVIVLPHETDGLASLEENIEQVLEPQPLARTQVAVDLPKFKIESQIGFVPILERLGIHSLFSPIAADLDGLSSNTKGLYVSDVVQKAFIEVNEYGIEAAAATEMAVATIYTPVAASFKVDHPFLYYLKDNGVILFSGRYTNPEA